ncbi:MAG: phospholipid carrier-dependent glycosyltransferase [Chloroflexota bacterium]
MTDTTHSLSTKTTYHILALLLVGSFILRVAFSIASDPAEILDSGGDDPFYFQVGQYLVTGYDYSEIVIPVPPLYLLVTGTPQLFLPAHTAVFAIQVFQALALTMACYFVFGIALCIAQDRRVALLAAGTMATSLAFITESTSLQTEPLYIALVLGGMWLYITGFLVTENSTSRRWLSLVLAGVLLGLGTLTRPVLLLFPFGLAIHLAMLREWKAIPTLLLAYALMTLTWTAYTSLYYEWTVIGSNQFIPAVWRGAVETDINPFLSDQALGDETYSEQASRVIQADLTGYLSLRIRETAGAILQPHGTLVWGDETSIRTLLVTWFNDGFSLEATQALLTANGFVPKLLIYIWHYVGLLGGIVGMWLTRDKWRFTLPLIGYIAYTVLLHFVSLFEPRYFFPTMPFFWVFATVTIVTMDALMRAKNGNNKVAPVQDS